MISPSNQCFEYEHTQSSMVTSHPFWQLMDEGGSRSEFVVLVHYNYNYNYVHVIVTDVLLGEVECKCNCKCNIFVTCIMAKSSSVCEHFRVSESAVSNCKA